METDEITEWTVKLDDNMPRAKYCKARYDMDTDEMYIEFSDYNHGSFEGWYTKYAYKLQRI